MLRVLPDCTVSVAGDGTSFSAPFASALALLRFSRYNWEWADHAYWMIKNNAVYPGWPPGQNLPNTINYYTTLVNPW